ncbi:kinase-like protein [Schizopora paradoxa]|uniref:Kinase-like protein n=1 Tax=Schizopora paradoxa TaxID=27342 RepID=A0A0H2RPF6_9AGAM|nr:kinase-like protein [Schizopora paradoxa]
MDRLESTLSSLAHLNLAGQIVEKNVHAEGFGGQSDVYSAWSRRHRKKVAVKQVRASLRNDLPLRRSLAKEICTWSKLDHDNVLPFLGFFTEGENMAPSMVCEWMEDGTMTVYMRKFPRGGAYTRTMLRGVAAGLSYLHSKKVIHADLKSHNILISRRGVPLLSDFGVSLALSQSQYSSGTTVAVKGTYRWMAAELLRPTDAKAQAKPDEKTDVWAFGMVIYELLSWKVPYWMLKNNIHVVLAIVNGDLPTKPDESDEPNMFKHLWELSLDCWKEAAARPTVQQLIDRLSTDINISEDGRDEASNARRRWRKVVNASIAIHRMQVWSHHEPHTSENERSTPESRRRVWHKAVNAVIAIRRMRPSSQATREPVGEAVKMNDRRRLWHKVVNACIAIYKMRSWSQEQNANERRDE